MGMIGLYKALPEQAIKRLAEGELDAGEVISTSGEQLDIDKAWQGIHYALTGELIGGEQPLSYVVPMIDNQGLDLGDFGAFYLYPAQVQNTAEAIKDFTQEEFATLFAKYDPLQEEVYPVTAEDDAEEFFAYLYQYFTDIQSYYQNVAASGKGVVFYIV